MVLHPKIRERKQTARQLERTSVSAADLTMLEKRESLLDERIIEGYAVIWDKPNMHGEIFRRGAFAKSISDMGPNSSSNYKIKLRDEHGLALVLFDEIFEDDIGLYFRTKPLDNLEDSERVLTRLRSGTYNNFSIGFRYVWDKMVFDEKNDQLIIHEARLYEISVVSIPSDMNTFAIRSADQLEDLWDDTEDFIQSIPRKLQYEARRLFSLHKSLMETKQIEQRDTSLEEREQVEEPGIDYDYLINNLKSQ